MPTFHPLLRLGSLALVALLLLATPLNSMAQDRPPERVLRTYIPPDQLVSFVPSTPFDQFVEFLNPIVERVTGKEIIDPFERLDAIGISIAGAYFLDAFELVLAQNGLTYTETERFFIVEEVPEVIAENVGDGTNVLGRPGATGSQVEAAAPLPASLDTREIKINAILFETNMTKLREEGLNWQVFLGQQQQGGQAGGGQGGGGLGGGNQQEMQPDFFLRTDDLFDSFDDFLLAPGVINFRQLASFFRFVEDEGLGETVANPSISVQSGEQGTIQIGSDIPIQTQDFAGNTVTQFFKTGIIIDVTPTLIREAVADTAGAPEIEFIHLNVNVENSIGRPSAAGVVIDRNDANTQVLLLDGEQTIIGGLYSTQESLSRRGVPILKDLPGWFLGLRYIFGNTQKTVSQRELVIVLQAELLDPLQARSERPLTQEMRLQFQDQVNRALRNFSSQKQDEIGNLTEDDDR
ncbi:MAG: type II and III secretion system protein [Bacteroidota bacterium]